jgi:tetratricopeptide (TPR) repeat protein
LKQCEKSLIAGSRLQSMFVHAARTGGFVLVLVALAGALRGESVDERFLSGLRERQLFGLAEAYCVEKLADSSLSEAERASLVVELSRTYSQHAMQVTPSAAEPLWKQAAEVTYEFAARLPSSPWNVLVKTQAALVLVARGELALAQSKLAGDSQQPLTEARNNLRLAARQLGETADDIAARLQQPPTRRDESTPARDELLGLQRNVAYHRARALRLQGESYPADSPDRLNSLTQAHELIRPLAQLSEADPLSALCRLEEIVCLRLMNDHQGALRRIEAALKQMTLPPAVALATRAEHLRLALDLKRIDAALALAEQGRRHQDATSAELDLALVEVYVAASREASEQDDNEAAVRHQSQAATLIAEIEKMHGPYWTRRAESLLAKTTDNKSPLPTGDLQVLIRTAEGHLQNRHFEAAVGAYDRARQFAEQAGASSRAFELAHAAASIEQQRGDHQAAAGRFRQLAKSMPRHAEAGNAHLLAISNVAAEARKQQPPQLDEYASLLEEHIQLWPEGKSSEQAHWLLGRLREHEGKLEQAIASYQKVPVDHPQFAAAIEGIANSYARLTSQLEQRGEPIKELQTAAARYFESLFVSADGRLPERWSPSQRLAATTAARIWMQTEPPDAARAERILNAAIEGAADAPQAWKATATTLLVLSLVAQQKYDESQTRLQALSAGAAQELVALVDPLQAADNATPTTPQQTAGLANLKREIVRLLGPRRGELDEPQQLKLARFEAQLLASTGKLDEAIERYQQLARAQPRDGQIQEELASLLLEKGDSASLQAALVKWREVEQQSRTATPRWFRAKYHLALTHERLGNKAQAAKLITLTQVLHPELGGPQWKPKFLELLARCKP